ncbi:hypothetical protein HL658_31340 [Azospirillum sp. RWY-5-1]|uniref:Uncharacterized protein n=1 Tax=Azospirillum oleiclasticum TaxID=2735135 RepID=A0ABX2TJT1_9PROT|nr:hypothetical protein [Azospirillum oleiclasticum]NYZ17060.1 hypothetical protein [Azospirillum oleiclasticum]NYZ24496.1 hypothetical protein [Azospirillum oleiclasticum]
MAAPKTRPAPARPSPAHPSPAHPAPEAATAAADDAPGPDGASDIRRAAAALKVPAKRLLAARIDGDCVFAVTVDGQKLTGALP